MASGCLQKKRPTPPKSGPGGLKIEARGGQHGVLEASGELLGGCWAPDGRRDRSGSAPRRLLGRSWREATPGGFFGASFDVSAPESEQRPTAYYFNDFEGFRLDFFGFDVRFLVLAWHASGEAANTS